MAPALADVLLTTGVEAAFSLACHFLGSAQRFGSPFPGYFGHYLGDNIFDNGRKIITQGLSKFTFTACTISPFSASTSSAPLRGLLILDGCGNILHGDANIGCGLVLGMICVCTGPLVTCLIMHVLTIIGGRIIPWAFLILFLWHGADHAGITIFPCLLNQLMDVSDVRSLSVSSAAVPAAVQEVLPANPRRHASQGSHPQRSAIYRMMRDRSADNIVLRTGCVHLAFSQHAQRFKRAALDGSA